MKDTITIKACAKINLTLDVTRKRSDGYHEIKSIMQSVDLKDSIYLEKGGRDIELFCSYYGIPEDPKNYAFIAAQKLKERVGSREGLIIKIDKKIPVAAGLGGGSADAAAVLVGLNILFGQPLKEKELIELAAKIGSDVPFFITGGTVLAAGRGEKIKKLPNLPSCAILIIKPSLEISTAWAYEHYDLDKFKSGRYTEDAIGIIRRRKLKNIAAALGNDLEQPIFKKHPTLRQLKEFLREQKEVLGTVMSGSGSAFLAILQNKKAAQKITKKLKKEGFTVSLTFPTKKALEIM
jgi:4-diphosphocytidyl-2-C-methyl-D-erythritol kinase